MKLNRRRLRRLIENLLFENIEMGKDLGVKNLDRQGVKKGTPLVRGEQGYGGFYIVTGEKIALHQGKKFVDGAIAAGLIYRALIYGLDSKEDLDVSLEDIKEIASLNKEYKPAYGTGDSMETKMADIHIMPNSMKDRYLAAFKFADNLEKKHPELYKKVFAGPEALLKLGKNLLGKYAQKAPTINPQVVLDKAREYDRMKKQPS